MFNYVRVIESLRFSVHPGSRVVLGSPSRSLRHLRHNAYFMKYFWLNLQRRPLERALEMFVSTGASAAAVNQLIRGYSGIHSSD